MRYAFRSLSRSKGFSLLAVLLLGLGMGASTAIFSLLNSVLFKSIVVKDPGRLVLLTNPGESGVSIGTDAGVRGMLSYAEYTALRQRMTTFSDMFAVDSQWRALNAIIDRGIPEEVRLRLVSGSYFQGLGIGPLLGRTFTAADEHGPGSAPYAVISHRFWRDRFRSSPDVLGRSFRIQGTSYRILGVMPAPFLGESVGASIDLWIPLVMQPQIRPGRMWLEDDPSKVERVLWLQVFGRLRDGTTIQQAQAEANVAFHQIITASFARFRTQQPDLLKEQVKLRPGAQGTSDVRGTWGEPLYILLALVGVLLLIACANVAGLMLARATSRRKEVAMRFALGATRLRLVRQFLAESLLVSLAGSVVGAGVAAFATQALIQLASRPGDRILLDLQPDLRVFVFIAAIASFAAAISGLAPALLSRRANLHEILRGAASNVLGGSRRLRAGKIVVASQVALCTLLLMTAGWFALTMRNLVRMNLGYPKEQLLQVRVDPLTAGYRGLQLASLYQQLRERLAAIPGVSAVAFSDNGLFSGRESADEIIVEGYTPPAGKKAVSQWDDVGPGYFATVGIPLLRGREIAASDLPGAPRVCIINRALADQYFPYTDPIGRHITDDYPDTRFTFEIIGISENAYDHDLRGTIPPRFYIPSLQPMVPGEYTDAMNYLIRTSGNSATVLEAARRQIAAVNPDIRIIFARSLDEMIAGRTLTDRLVSALALAAGVLALLITCFGLYAVLSYAVALRKGEIGVRIALGAEPGQITRAILREALGVAAIGLALGVPAALGLSTIVRSRFFGVSAADPLTIALVVGTLLLTGTLAALVPARRAARLNPIRALQSE